ncbi:unnamed protein product [Notodromas monacha]|uniref:PID domain-containing protein n=1 Tax=Notodromas monacha TaxID=399045 RepID=A0A7R9BFA6_9CRUS|nr:unnamed protein product [Notodromas monacha]CAG0914338.1 unnamed protein product [Notodromas monacha]
MPTGECLLVLSCLSPWRPRCVHFDATLWPKQESLFIPINLIRDLDVSRCIFDCCVVACLVRFLTRFGLERVGPGTDELFSPPPLGIRRHEPSVLIEGVLFRARYLGSTQLVCEGQPTKATRMIQAEEAVSRIKFSDDAARSHSFRVSGSFRSRRVDLVSTLATRTSRDFRSVLTFPNPSL